MDRRETGDHNLAPVFSGKNRKIYVGFEWSFFFYFYLSTNFLPWQPESLVQSPKFTSCNNRLCFSLTDMDTFSTQKTNLFFHPVKWNFSICLLSLFVFSCPRLTWLSLESVASCMQIRQLIQLNLLYTPGASVTDSVLERGHPTANVLPLWLMLDHPSTFLDFHCTHLAYS